MISISHEAVFSQGRSRSRWRQYRSRDFVPGVSDSCQERSRWRRYISREIFHSRQGRVVQVIFWWVPPRANCLKIIFLWCIVSTRKISLRRDYRNRIALREISKKTGDCASNDISQESMVIYLLRNIAISLAHEIDLCIAWPMKWNNIDQRYLIELIHLLSWVKYHPRYLFWEIWVSSDIYWPLYRDIAPNEFIWLMSSYHLSIRSLDRYVVASKASGLRFTKLVSWHSQECVLTVHTSTHFYFFDVDRKSET